jgi:hypothetical protein
MASGSSDCKAISRVLYGPFSQTSPETMGGVFLLCLGAGFALATALSMGVLRCACWWALVVEALLGLVGLNLLVGNPSAPSGVHLGQYWPLLLVGVGLYLILRQWRGRQTPDGL